MSKKPESIGGLVEKIAGPPLARRIKELEAEIRHYRKELERIGALDYRGNQPYEQRIAKDALEWPARKSLMDRGMEP